MKKVFAIALCLVLVLSLCPAVGLAAESASDANGIASVAVTATEPDANGAFSVTLTVTPDTARSVYLTGYALSLKYDDTLVSPDMDAEGAYSKTVKGKTTYYGVKLIGMEPTANFTTNAFEDSGNHYFLATDVNNDGFNGDDPAAPIALTYYFELAEDIKANGGNVDLVLATGAASGKALFEIGYYIADDESEGTISTLAETVSKKIIVPKPPVSSAAVTGDITTPVKGETDATALSAGEDFTVTWAWDNGLANGSVFAPSTAYTLTITLKANEGVTLTDDATVKCLTDTVNENLEKQTDGSYKLTKTFDKTADKAITGLEITTPPTKTAYVYNETFDPAGMKVTATYDVGDPDPDFKDYTIEPSGALAVGTETVTVKAGNYSDTQAITVAKAPNPAVVTSEVTVTFLKSKDLNDLVKDAQGDVTFVQGNTIPEGSSLNGSTFTAGQVEGTCTVTVNIAGNANYESTSKEITVKVISKPDQENFKFAEAAKTAVYGDTVTAVPTGALENPTITYKSSDETVATVDADGKVTILKIGTATITATAAETETYAETEATYTLTVEPKEIGLTWENTELTYTGAEQAPTATATGLAEGDACAVTVTGAKKDAGEYTATASALSNANYKLPAEATKAFTVAAMEANLRWTGTELTYTGEEQAPTAVVANLVEGDECTVTVTGGKTDAGEGYTATATALSNANYKLPAAATTTFAIAKAEWDGEKTAAGETKYGTESSVDLSALIADKAALGTPAAAANEILDGEPAVAEGKLTYKLKADAALVGKTAVVTIPVTGAANYKDYTLTVTITLLDKYTQDNFKFAEETKEVTYGDAEFTVTATGSVDDAALKYASSDAKVAEVEEATGKVTIKGAGSAVISAYSAGNEDYAEATVSYTLTVKKAALTVTALDKRINVGNEVPSLAAPEKGTDYSVTGLVGEDELDYSAIKMIYKDDAGEVAEADVDNSTAGEYGIAVSGVVIPDAIKANYEEIQYVNGTLSIRRVVAPAPVTPAPAAQDTGATVENGEIVVTPEVEEGAAEAEVAEASVTEALEEAEEGAPLNVKVQTQNANEVKLTLQPAAVKALAEAETGLAVETEQGTVELDAEAVKEAAEAGGDVAVEIKESDDGAIALVATANGKALDASVKIAVPAKAEGQVLVIINEDGTLDIVEKSLVEDGVVYAIIPAGANVKLIDNEKLFDDVANDAWYKDSVAFTSSHELFKGMSATEFGPEVNMTRGMLVTVLYRLEGAIATGTNPYSDVADTAYYADAVIWATEMGIVEGMGEGFVPNANVTRQQIAAIFQRYMNVCGGKTTETNPELNVFADSADTSSWASEAMDWAVSNGLFQGNGDGTLNPKGEASRAEVATLLMRLVALIVK